VYQPRVTEVLMNVAIFQKLPGPSGLQLAKFAI